MEEPKKQKSSGLFTGIIVGGAVGSVLSFLFATEERRDKTKKMSHEILKKGKSVAEKFLEKYKK
ncbi:YtxH domain-containing protein [Candidatus Gracilibacteria bacterium]|nr:YtxH domain-containing protein [Candidatus Gracilibacteria bacterium]MCF7819356.1 YtxH domain-containing protein [Candidatus Gracilibacteria bacterium]